MKSTWTMSGNHFFLKSYDTYEEMISITSINLTLSTRHMKLKILWGNLEMILLGLAFTSLHSVPFPISYQVQRILFNVYLRIHNDRIINWIVENILVSAPFFKVLFAFYLLSQNSLLWPQTLGVKYLELSIPRPPIG